jgi:hypothetical protein
MSFNKKLLNMWGLVGSKERECDVVRVYDSFQETKIHKIII